MPYLSFLFNAAAVHASSWIVSKVGMFCAVCDISELAAAPSQSATCADMVRARGVLGPSWLKMFLRHVQDSRGNAHGFLCKRDSS